MTKKLVFLNSYYYLQSMQEYFVYILANNSHSTLYVGMTNDLKRRLYEHQNKLVPGFTEKYNVNKLVYYEKTTDVKAAIQREKNLKKWNRAWKLELIEKNNPTFKDLSLECE
ncbi:GIY-YIG nuclease family protein [Treponema bryantii]|uniref:GIY-YIG nuclease family protein n=1 Tax=Treponema bryantii TaxID=163 RepID=UPI0003B31259|nr:GIY-YIG nuclease family protein [Treponema bryantii]